MNTKKTKITILMPVYNSEKYLKEAIESILNQTFSDFEFLIINDGSTDQSAEIIKSYSDNRIKFINNDTNKGYVCRLNEGIKLSNGEYIARMDSDDISLSCRFEKQVQFLEANPDIAICGTLIKTFGDVNSSVFRYPEYPDLIKSNLIFKCSMAHPTIIIRKSSLEKNNLLYYDETFMPAEDYDLWVRASKKLKLYNIQKVLLLYRMHTKQVSQDCMQVQLTSARQIMLNQLKELGIEPTEEELNFHQHIGMGNVNPSKEFVNKTERWLLKLKETNNKNKYLLEPAFSYVVAEQWFIVCIKAAKLGFWSCMKFFFSPLSRKNNLSIKSKIKLINRCIKL